MANPYKGMLPGNTIISYLKTAWGNLKIIMLNERRHKEYIFMIISLNFTKCNSLTATYSERKWVRAACREGAWERDYQGTWGNFQG